MAKIVCDTSAIQYLYQLELLRILPALSECVIIPPAVVREISVGKAAGVNLPDVERFDWLEIHQPNSLPALPLVTDLGPGETEVLMLALESRELVTVLDDALARQIAETLDLQFTGTLGLLLDAKCAGLVSEVAPLLDQLDALRFRLASHTRRAVIKLAGELKA